MGTIPPEHLKAGIAGEINCGALSPNPRREMKAEGSGMDDLRDNLAALNALGTEQPDPRSRSLDALTTMEFVTLMNAFDREAAGAVERALPDIARAIDAIADRLRAGGRLFYIGAGTSGRLGVLDASECPPTFGVPDTLVQGIIAGGDRALRYAVEGAEDDAGAAAKDLDARGFASGDALVAISASGYAPYCIGGLGHARAIGAAAISLACNENAPMSAHADIAIEAPTGAEILAGSTRLKAGTATKMILNMLTTGVMVRLGKVYRNLMVDVRATNAKLRDRVVRIVMHATGLARPEAEALLAQSAHDPKVAIVMHESGETAEASRQALAEADGIVTDAIARTARK
ncbi:N-acetylmuramic acid 6-phosphate etherase [Eubacteriales bacterium OttesenSCG-928-A19]|nr:N-acetylmuramic acid 6-phosphate etherase [Eubacteriales bacterium OttesenSCG-928-A19]